MDEMQTALDATGFTPDMIEVNTKVTVFGHDDPDVMVGTHYGILSTASITRGVRRIAGTMHGPVEPELGFLITFRFDMNSHDVMAASDRVKIEIIN